MPIDKHINILCFNYISQIELCDFALNYHHLVSVTSSPELTCPISTGTTYELGIDIDFDLLWTAAINTELEVSCASFLLVEDLSL